MKKSSQYSFLKFSRGTVASASANVLKPGQKTRLRIPDRVPYASEMIQIGGEDICFHTYDPDTKFADRPPKALIIFFHGYIAHGTLVTSRMVADLMVSNGYACVSADAPGHGRSAGIRGYLESGEKVTNFGVGVVDHAYKAYLGKIAAEKAKNPGMKTPGLKVFLIGSSMGANISLQTSLRRPDLVNGVVLMAPMLRITAMNPFTRFFLMKSAKMMPLTEAIPVGKCKHYRSPEIAKECEKDMLKPHQQGDWVRLGTIKTLVELTDSLEAQYENIVTPCFIMVGDEDKQVNNEGATDLAKKARSQDMTLKHYPALHGLMGEPAPLVNRMQNDMIRWLDERCKRDQYIRSSM